MNIRFGTEAEKIGNRQKRNFTRIKICFGTKPKEG